MPNPYGSPSFDSGGVQVALYLGGDDDPSPIRESWAEGQGLTVQVDFLLRWSDRIRFLQALSGTASYAGGTYRRILPIQLPPNPNDKTPGLDGQPENYLWDRLACVGVSDIQYRKFRTDVDGSATGFKGWGCYEMAVLTTNWAVPSYIIGESEFAPDFPGADLSGFPFTTTQIKAAGESYSPYATGYKFKSTDEHIDDAKVAILRPQLEITVVRHQMPFVDAEKYNALVGTINGAPFKFGNAAFEIGSILYIGYEPESYPDVSTGGLMYNITHHLVAKGSVKDVDDRSNSSWNSFVAPNGKWDQVVTVQGGATVYPESDMHLDIWPEYAS